MMSYRLLILLPMLLWAALPARSQIGTGDRGPSMSIEIHGQVRLSRGGAPAENVLVRLDSFSGGLVTQVLTDRTGKFRFSGLQQATYIVSAHFQGYRDAQKEVNLATTTSEYVLLQLVPDPSAISRPATEGPAGSPVNANVPAEAQREYQAGQSIVASGKDLPAGITHLQKSLSIDPNFLAAQLLLGTAYMELRQWDNAEKALRRAQQIDEKAPEPRFALGEVLRRQKRYPEAEKTLKEGLQIENVSWQGHLTLARVYWDMGTATKDVQKSRTALESAWQEVNRALESKPDLAEAHLLAGNLLFRARRAKDALPHYEEYLKLDPEGESAAQTRALVEKIKKALAQEGDKT